MTKVSTAGWIFALSLLAGCSTFSGAPVDASAYASMGCNELNEKVGSVSRELSQTAVTRGKVADIPGWVPGATRVASKVIDRQTARIDGLQEEVRAIAAARDRTCARQPPAEGW